MTGKLVGGSRPSVTHGFEHQPIIKAEQNLYGGFIVNSADNQNVEPPESLYVSIVGPATLFANATTSEIEAGATFNVPPRVALWVNSVTNGHFYTAVFGVAEAQKTPTEVPVGGSFPDWPLLDKDGNAIPTGLTHVMYAYLYQEYSDDDDLQEFVKVLNAMQQDYVDTFNRINLPIYPKLPPSGAPPHIEQPIATGGRSPLADWAMHGIYGWLRPTVYTTKAKLIGPLNTYWPNYPIPLNMLEVVEPKGVTLADDDFYKRGLTWHLQKGDGKYFNVRWLKRRVMRFLTGTDGTSPHIDNTWRISISFGANWGVTIRIVMRKTFVMSGAFPNGFGCNGMAPGTPFFQGPRAQWGRVTPNSIVTTFETYPTVPYADRLEQAVAAGILELPFQFRWRLYIG